MSILFSICVIIAILCKVIAKLSCGSSLNNTCLVGKTAIVTGGNQGIGYQVVLGLAAKGCRVIIADKDDSNNSKKLIINETDNPNIISKKFDLSSVESIQNFVLDILSTEDRLDILINNAGCGCFTDDETEDGLNKLMQINHFGPFLLTYLLVDLLKKTPSSRIIFTSSYAAIISRIKPCDLNKPSTQMFMCDSLRNYFAYANTKLCAIITSNYFALKLQTYGITCNSVYPGIVNTNLINDSSSKFKQSIINRFMVMFVLGITWIFGKTQLEGAQTTLHIATSKTLANVTGKYFHDCKIFPQPWNAWNKEYCNEIIKETIKLLKLKDTDKVL